MRKLVTGWHAAMVVLLAAAPAVASQTAPPQYQSSNPSDGATVHRPPDRVEATFDQPLDGQSTLMVTDECGRRIDARDTDVSGNSMSVGLDQKPSGGYQVDYMARGLGGITGQARGQFTFTVHGGPSCGGGHGDHGGHGNGDGNGNQGGDHGGGHGGDHGGGGGHQDDDHGGTGHGGGADHQGSAGHSGNHAATSSGSGHEGHGGSGSGSAAGGHANHDSASGNGSSAAGGDVDGITSSDTARNLLTRADSAALMIALLLCALLGIAGGAILRATNLR